MMNEEEHLSLYSTSFRQTICLCTYDAFMEYKVDLDVLFAYSGIYITILRSSLGN